MRAVIGRLLRRPRHLARWSALAVGVPLRRLRTSDRRADCVVHVSALTVQLGMVRLRGWVESPVPVLTVTLHVPDGTTVRTRLTRSGRRVTHPRTNFALDHRLGLAPAAVAGSSIRVRLADGRMLTLDDAGSPRDDPAHALTGRFFDELRERPAGRLLEVGSRDRSSRGVYQRSSLGEGWTYEGLDVVEGDNVDTVGDAHRLSDIYPAESFDAILAVSVLEHLIMPWRFVIELNRVLRPGALGLFVTHQSWPLHDEPYDYFRFSDRAWHGLLNPGTGFEIVSAQLGERGFVVPMRVHAATAFGEDLPAAALVSAVLFRKVGPTSLTWPVDPSDLEHVGGYPVGG